jgi:hypothetical protein
LRFPAAFGSSVPLDRRRSHSQNVRDPPLKPTDRTDYWRVAAHLPVSFLIGIRERNQP